MYYVVSIHLFIHILMALCIFMHLWIPTWDDFFLLEEYTFASERLLNILVQLRTEMVQWPSWAPVLVWAGSHLLLAYSLSGFEWRTWVASQGPFSSLRLNSMFHLPAP